MDEKRLAEIERGISHEASPKGAAMARELVGEVRQLRVLLETKEAHAAETARALQAACNRSIVTRRAERERCAKHLEALAKKSDASAWDRGYVSSTLELAAESLRALPDAGPEET